MFLPPLYKHHHRQREDGADSFASQFAPLKEDLGNLANFLSSSTLRQLFYVFQQQQNGKDTKILTEHPPQSLITFLTIENNNLDTYSDLS